MTAARRVLLLAPFPPGALPAHGGSVVIAALAKSLSQRNRVALAYLRAQDEAEADPTLKDCCETVVEVRRPGVSVSSIRPLRRLPMLLPRLVTGHPLWVASRWSGAFAATVRALTDSWRPDIIQAEFGAMGVYLPAARRSPARTVVTFHDAEASSSREHAMQLSGPTRFIWRADARLWRAYDRRLLRSVDAAVALTTRDARALSGLAPEVPVTTIPFGVAMPSTPPDPIGARPPRLLFVGNFIHPPNVDAAKYLLDEIFPRVRATHPGLELALVGDHPPDWLRARAGQGIHVPGFVADLPPMLSAATLVVAPLRSGGGMRAKVLEALAAGKAMVGTSLAFEGIGVTSGRQALVADETAAFCAAIDRLVADEAARVAIGQAAREHVATSFSWDSTARAYEALYDRLHSGGR